MINNKRIEKKIGAGGEKKKREGKKKTGFFYVRIG